MLKYSSCSPYWIVVLFVALIGCGGSDATAPIVPPIPPVTPDTIPPKLNVLSILGTRPEALPVATTDSIKLRLTDSAGVPRANAKITFTPITNGVFGNDSIVMTDTAGNATVVWTLGTHAQSYGLLISCANTADTWIQVRGTPGPLVSGYFTKKLLVITGASTAIPLQGNDVYGNGVHATGEDATCEIRTPGVIELDTTALTVTRAAVGQTFLVCSVGSSPADSTLVAALPDQGVLIGALGTPFEIESNDQLLTTITMDAGRHGSIGSMTFTVTWDTTQMTYVDYTDVTWLSPVVNTTEVANGRLVFSYASAVGLSGSVSLLQLRFNTTTPGQTGALAVSVSEGTDARTFVDALPKMLGLSKALVLK